MFEQFLGTLCEVASVLGFLAFFVESDTSWNEDFVLINALLGCINTKTQRVPCQRGVDLFKHPAFWFTVLVFGFKRKGS